MIIMSNIDKTGRSLTFQNRLLDLIDEDECPKSKIHLKIGISNSTLAKASNYGIIPKVSILIQIADYFKISIDYLIGNIEDDSFIKSTSNITFYQRLDELKESKHIKTDYALAKNLHFESQLISRWRIKKYLPSLNLLELLADYFKVSIDYLLGRSD